MQDHRLGFPAVLAALYPPEAQAPSLSRFVPRRDAEADIERASHDKHFTGQLVAPAVVARYVEPAYVPEFDQVRPAADAEAPAAPTTWQDGAPPCVGWRQVNVVVMSLSSAGDEFAYWFGDGWSYFGPADQVEQEDIERGPVHSTDYIQWRGPRLTGDAWPEPSAA